MWELQIVHVRESLSPSIMVPDGPLGWAQILWRWHLVLFAKRPMSRLYSRSKIGTPLVTVHTIKPANESPLFKEHSRNAVSHRTHYETARRVGQVLMISIIAVYEALDMSLAHSLYKFTGINFIFSPQLYVATPARLQPASPNIGRLDLS